MGSRLICSVERSQPVTLLQVHGVLDSATASDLRAGLLDCLADQPVAVVIDMSELIVVDKVTLAVVTDVARQNERWPGVRLAVAGADPDLLAALDRLGVGRHLTSYPDGRLARRQVGQWPRPLMWRGRIPGDRYAPAAARAAVAQFCADHGVDAERDVAALVASELVTNAVVHAGTTIELLLHLSESTLHVAVRDGGKGRVHLTGIMDESADHGRGLVLVDALARDWGTIVPHRGKVVWATVPVQRVGAQSML